MSGLPAPVERYLAFALPAGSARPRQATLRQEGSFRRGTAWCPFTATETFTADPPAFAWEAAIRMMPLVTVRVRDSYEAGVGRMRATWAGILTFVNQGGTPAMASASLLRWLAEAAWFPVALMPREQLRWEGTGPDTARVHLADRGVEVSLDVRFGMDGGIVEVNAKRHRDVRGTQVLTPWRGRFADYSMVGGLMIPLTGEVAWIVDGKEEPYWRGRVTGAEFT